MTFIPANTATMQLEAELAIAKLTIRDDAMEYISLFGELQDKCEQLEAMRKVIEVVRIHKSSCPYLNCYICGALADFDTCINRFK